MSEKWIVVSGNLSDGFVFTGTFDSDQDAALWARDNAVMEWDVILLTNPWEM